MNLQRTLRKSITLSGVGLHSGQLVQLVIRPARPNHGIVFVRLPDTQHNGLDQNYRKSGNKVSALYKNVVNTQLATVLGQGDVTISTVEHLLAALHGAEIDNAVIEVNAPELPVLDGSAAQFFEKIQAAGTRTQFQIRPYLALRRKVSIEFGEKWAVAEPCSHLEIHGSVEWNHPVIGYQEFRYIEGKTAFSELAGARTFGFLRDVENLRKMGFAKGGSLANAIVLDDSSVLNPEGLRFPDEFVRHKVLDALGDIKLAGIPIRGYFRLHRTGHDMHNQLITEIFKNPNNFELIDHTISKPKLVPQYLPQVVSVQG